MGIFRFNDPDAVSNDPRTPILDFKIHIALPIQDQPSHAMPQPFRHPPQVSLRRRTNVEQNVDAFTVRLTYEEKVPSKWLA